MSDAVAHGMKWHNIDFYQNGKIGYLKSMLAYIKMLEQEEPDIIHCQMARVTRLALLRPKWLHRMLGCFTTRAGLDAETYQNCQAV